MRRNLAGILSQTPRGVNGNPALAKKKAGLELLPSQLIPFSNQPLFSDGDDDACGVGEPGGRCSSTAVQSSNNRFGNKDTHRNSCAGSIHIPDIRSSRTGMRGNQIRSRPVQRRLKPERQLVLPEPEPAQLLPMEVKEVFS